MAASASSTIESLRRENDRLAQELELANRLNELCKEQRDRGSAEKAELERKIDGLKAQNQNLTRRIQQKDGEIKQLNEKVAMLASKIGPFCSTVLQIGGPGGQNHLGSPGMSLPSPIRNQSPQQSEGERGGPKLANKENVLQSPPEPHDQEVHPTSEDSGNHDQDDESRDIIFSSTLQNISELSKHITTLADDDSTDWVAADTPDQFILVRLKPEVNSRQSVVPFGGTNVNLNANIASVGTVADGAEGGAGDQTEGNAVPAKRSRGGVSLPGRGRGARARGRGARATSTTATIMYDQIYTYFVARVVATKHDESRVQNIVFRVQYFRKMHTTTQGVPVYNPSGRGAVTSTKASRVRKAISELLYFVPYENQTVYEVDEEAVETRLPPPQYQRRGHVQFNFPFENYRLG